MDGRMDNIMVGVMLEIGIERNSLRNSNETEPNRTSVTKTVSIIYRVAAAEFLYSACLMYSTYAHSL